MERVFGVVGIGVCDLLSCVGTAAGFGLALTIICIAAETEVCSIVLFQHHRWWCCAPHIVCEAAVVHSEHASKDQARGIKQSK